MMIMGDSKILRVKEQMVLREEFDDWAVLYNPDTGKAMGLSPTGVTLWKCLASEAPCDLEVMIKAISEEYDHVSDNIAQEIKEFIDNIIGYGFTEEGIR